MAPARSLHLIHLVWAPLGPGALREFARALRKHPPATDHKLVLAMNGFTSCAQAERYLDEVADLSPEALFFAGGLDLPVYFAAAERLHGERYCFVNSYSRPLVDGWLAKLDAALDPPEVGLAGASGSWASPRSWTAYSLGLPSAYAGVLPPPHIARAQLLAVELEHAQAVRRTALESLRARWSALRQLPQLERFPAAHIRTNAFMISHATIERLRLGSVRKKPDAHALEHGRHSITRQVQRMGLQAHGQQEGLLVADNRTRAYQDGDGVRRRVLSGYAWGAAAR
jgi:hypothetical protein